MDQLKNADELNLEKLNLSNDAYRVVKDVDPGRLIDLVQRNMISELFQDEDGLPLYYCHWEKLFFIRQEIVQKLAKAGFVDLTMNRYGIAR